MTLCVPKAHGRKYQTGFINDLNQLLTNAVTPIGGGTTNWTYTYNLDGTLSTKNDGTNTYSYTWDPGGDQRLLSMALNGVTQVAFTYDSKGRMLTRTPYSAGVAQTPTNFEWDGSRVVREFAPAGTYRYYAPQGELITFDYTPTAGATSTYCCHCDCVGSVRMITDSSGASVAHYEYDAWANLLASSSDISFGFNYRYVGALGVRWDATLGMYYMLNRFYDPQTQRFVSKDPIGLEGGVNLYRYAENNPVLYRDPNGLQTRGQAQVDRITRLLRLCGFGSLAEDVEQNYGGWLDDQIWILPDTGGLTLPGIGFSIKTGQSDIAALDVAVHESFHAARQGGLRITIEGFLSKFLRRPKAEYSQEYEVYEAEAEFLVEFLKCSCLDEQDKAVLRTRLHWIRTKKLPELRDQFNDWYF